MRSATRNIPDCFLILAQAKQTCSVTAQAAQAGCWKLGKDISPAVSASLRLLCLPHNLLGLFEAGIAESGIINDAEQKRREW